ncbi:hypothetical protein KBK19_15075 [Microvirga sp. STR05]|uniref:DUF304 domain-containing protein n=1 Tax=Hymenobacter duratus TaxID=2771356 RepID=A0ABR8JHN5_9BACT|nr:hypothetical protein [Hymenobacter duratus]MBD2716361.1 hypothetical protein [Hymenobacter duratus]MBR7951276.1 hypothetical protein [Microvirga sp. STR05]
MYDGILRRPFLFEHWHKGFVAALAIWLPAFSVATWAELGTEAAVWVASVVSCVVVLSVLTYREGFSLNTTTQQYRSYIWVAGLRFGKWQPLPPVSGLLLRPYITTHFLPTTAGKSNITRLNTPAPTTQMGLVAREYKWQVLLQVKDSPIGIIAAYTGYEEAVCIANKLATVTGLEVATVHA